MHGSINFLEMCNGSCSYQADFADYDLCFGFSSREEALRDGLRSGGGCRRMLCFFSDGGVKEANDLPKTVKASCDGRDSGTDVESVRHGGYNVQKKKNSFANSVDINTPLSLYAGISKAAEVNRVWESLKKSRPEVNNMSYLVMLQAPSNLGDMDGIKKIFSEWESNYQVYEWESNIAINTYLKGDMYLEAERILDGAMKTCKGPFSKARQLLMIYLLENGRVDSAMNHLEAAVSDSAENKDDWCWSSELASLFFLHFEKAKDVDGAEEFCKILSNLRPLDSETVTFLLKTYAAAEKTCPDMHERLFRQQIQTSLF
ncbi:unnamed protein product [Thlaspi arvense]|uniref:Uncharacterized protein n=1 Tax=Thlaspi arvense TaxID=13288 RepID=A0AAU9REW2_THLAR|nr:unnamed protein product [Thlaspi arvense]